TPMPRPSFASALPRTQIRRCVARPCARWPASRTRRRRRYGPRWCVKRASKKRGASKPWAWRRSFRAPTSRGRGPTCCRAGLAPIRTEALPQLEAGAASLSAAVVAELRRVYAGDAEALQKMRFNAGAKIPETGEYERYALTQQGNAANGERLFFNEQGVACV